MTTSPARHQSHRLRRGRFSAAGGIYLVTATCRNRRPIFGDLRRGRCCVRALVSASSCADTLCYVVMPDHMHWLLQLHAEAELSRIVQKMKSRTSKFLHDLDPNLGPVWQAGFHDRALRREESLLTVARYVVANPLRAGIAQSLGCYPHWDAVWL